MICVYRKVCTSIGPDRPCGTQRSLQIGPNHDGIKVVSCDGTPFSNAVSDTRTEIIDFSIFFFYKR